MNPTCPLCTTNEDRRIVPEPGPTRNRGKLVFTQTSGDDAGEDARRTTGYARWITTGHYAGTMPDYSIQRFDYKHNRRTNEGREVPDYYRVYYRGMSRSLTLSGKKEYSTFGDACAACDTHYHTNRGD
jgi:hypothetical protein